MTAGDRTVERAAEKLEQAAASVAARGGLAAKLGRELADDAAFLRKLKPSLIAARARGEAPTDGKPDRAPAAPPGPQLARPRTGRAGSGPNPFVVVGLALAAGVLLAKAIDWRSHAHPRR